MGTKEIPGMLRLPASAALRGLSRSRVQNFTRLSVRSMSAEADKYQELTGKSGFFGTAHEQPAGSYDNTIHEQEELWWDDGTAIREPILDSDYIPLNEAVPMFL